jgi:hypothetical protein
MGDGEGTRPVSQEGHDGGAGVDTRIGTVVGKYVIVRLLGKGGMGAVYEARHAELSRRFAVKFLLPEFAAHREVLTRFENEARAAGALEHPNLVAVTDVGRTAEGAPYLVMEFLKGEDCSQLLRRLGPLPVMRAADIVLQACRGLAVAHDARIVHRDLKPENLFVAVAGDGSDQVKVLDFGIAQVRSPERSRITRTGTTFGTAHYMSPEQARAASDVDVRTDVWSLGVVLYELLGGKKPFEGEQFLHVIHQILTVDPPTLQSLRPGLPASLLSVVQRAMTKSVTERLPSVAALADALAPFAGRPSLATGVAADVDATRATSFTGAGRASSKESGATGMTAAQGDPQSLGHRPRAAAKVWVAMGVGFAALVTIAGAVVHRGAPGASSPPATSSQRAASAPIEHAPEAQVEVPGTVRVTLLAPAVSTALVEAGAGASPSVPFEHSSNNPRSPGGGTAKGAQAPAPVHTPTPTRSVSAADAQAAPTPAPSHRTNIDRSNPYP